MQKTQSASWEAVPKHIADYARSFETKGLAQAEYDRLRALAPAFSKDRAPENQEEWDLMAALHALIKQRHCFEIEERRVAAERKNEKQPVDLEYGHTIGSRGGRVRCVTAICQANGDTSGEIYGHGPRSVTAALAILTKRCSCGAGWHMEDV